MPHRKIKLNKKINNETIVKLFVNSGGRCSFNGCNKFLLKDSLTLREYNASNIAHIVAKSLNGPRGNSKLPLEKRNNIDNLMLVCRDHHKLIDDNNHIKKYPVSLLKKYKNEHESRIYKLTGLSPNRKTKVICFKYQIGNEQVKISNEEIHEAIHPHFPSEENLEIDCTVGDLGTKKYYECMAEDIKNKIGKLNEEKNLKNISVFALAPIPLLAHLGNVLSNKINLDLYQRHRTVPETWKWPKIAKENLFISKRIKIGKEKGKVALIIGLSGTISIATLPKKVVDNFSIYSISLKNQIPAPTFLQSKKTLANFKNIYQTAIRTINKNESPKEIHLFPAVPAPIAVLCGRELLKKIDPKILIYDNNKKKKGFYHVLTIN